MNIFIKAKAWQLFLLFIVPLLLEPVLLAVGVKLSTVIAVVMPISSLSVVGWIWSVGIKANRYLPVQLKKSTKVYNGGLAFAVIYLLVFEFVLMPHQIPSWILPIHLASMFFMFYALWFAAKQFVTVQRQREVKFMDFSGPFFLLWFYPIGVWSMQPQINNLLGNAQPQSDAAE